MPKEIIPIDPQFAAKLKVALDKFKVAKEELENAQGAIYTAAGKLPEKGTTHVTGCKIETGFNEKYDQAKVAALQAEWAKKSNLPFPFKIEWKADAAFMKVVKESAPALYKEIEDALTLTNKKPTFTLED